MFMSNSKSMLFIGGPKDREVIDVPLHSYTYKVPGYIPVNHRLPQYWEVVEPSNIKRNPFYIPDVLGLDPPKHYTKHVYRLEKLKISGPRIIMEFYVHEDLSIFEAMKRLFVSYANVVPKGW